MRGPATVRFIPVKDGDIIDDGSDSPTGKRVGAGNVNHFIGFKPGRSGAREGWLVYLVHTGTPKSAQVRKLRR